MGKIAMSAAMLFIVLPAVAEETRHNGKTAAIELTSVKLQTLLGKHLAGHKGKVVLIDVWGVYCPSCKAEFTNVLRFHKTYADRGLVCMSLSLDDEKDRDKAVKFLRSKEARFANFWLEEGYSGAGKHWDFKIIPAVIIYGKDGKLARVFKCVGNKDFTYEEVESVLKKLLE